MSTIADIPARLLRIIAREALESGEFDIYTFCMAEIVARAEEDSYELA